MRRAFLFTILLAGLLIGPVFGQSDKKIPSSEASQHVGEKAAVCGYIASTRYLSSSPSTPTFLNFGKPYPQEDFTVVIWSEDRVKFGEPEIKYLHKNICVTGEITQYRGRPQIIAKNVADIKEQSPPSTSQNTTPHDYTNSEGKRVQSPTYSETVPVGATAQCRDGRYSFSQHRQGTCSHHGGVARWLDK